MGYNDKRVVRRLAACVLFGASLLVASWVFAQDADQSSGSGVLVSGGGDTPDLSDQDPSAPGRQKHQDSEGDAPSQDNAQTSGGNGDASNSSTDEIVIKATDAVMFQITANMKLTQDQINAIRPIIMDNITKVRDLQLSVQKGNIDSKAMYDQKEQLNAQEDQQLGRILTSDQMKIWTNIQSQ
jgi:parvulin-like peptidyl-prolyl isomerase